MIITKVGIPSFVVTLAGLLAWNGVVLLLIGSRGTVVLQDDLIIGFANDFVPETSAWVLMLLDRRRVRRRPAVGPAQARRAPGWPTTRC